MKIQALVAAAVLFFVLTTHVSAQEDTLESAVAALQRSDFPSAEQILRRRLRTQPKDGLSLGILAVVLDQEKKYMEADQAYRGALANSAHDSALLNNFGNHLVATKKMAEARKTFLAVVSIDPANVNALVQLAQIAYQAKSPSEALRYLQQLPEAAQQRPDALMLRMEAEYASGDRRKGDEALARISAESKPSDAFALGVALASSKQYDKAEEFFSRAHEANRGDFTTLYDLGLAASHAGHNERALGVLQEALAQQPLNVDLLYDLAAVNVALDRKEAALALLAQASQLVPERADILQLEARTAASLGFFGDADQAWRHYLALVPADQAAARDRAFVQTAIGEKMTEALAELQAYVRNHSADALGHYELGIAEAPARPEAALQEFESALALKPDMDAAHFARGLALYREGRLPAALADFHFVAQREPDNATVLDRLGETYMGLGQTAEALPVLRKAAALAPSNSTVLLHLGRALAKAGQQQEADALFARCRELGPTRSASAHPTGLIDFLGLSPQEQIARFRAGVERTIQSDPGNLDAQVRYLGILLEERESGKAALVVSTLSAHKASTLQLSEAARMLLAAREYTLVHQLLTVNGTPTTPELAIDLALAELHGTLPQASLTVLDSIPETQRAGDYFLARAQILHALHQPEETEDALALRSRGQARRPDLLLQAALQSIEDQHPAAARELLAQAERVAPNDAAVFLLRAILSELSGDHTDADARLAALEDRFPDWDKVWSAHALILEYRGQPESARPMLEAAAALGAAPDLVPVEHAGSLTDASFRAAVPALFP